MDEAILNKIRKILALGQSPNEAEAASAITKAHALLKQYNLSISDVTSTSTPVNAEGITLCDYFSTKDDHGWKVVLLSKIATSHYCSVLQLPLTSGGSSFKLVGKEHNIYIAKILADYLFEVVIRLTKAVSTKYRDSYRNGVVDRLAERLDQIKIQDNEGSDSKALVVCEKALILNYMASLGYKKNENTVHNPIDKGYVMGYEAGGMISLNQQISGSKTPQGTYLPKGN